MNIIKKLKKNTIHYCSIKDSKTMSVFEAIKGWWSTVPPITRFMFANCLVLTILPNTGAISFFSLTMDFAQIFKGFEIWRFYTASFCMGKFGIHFVSQLAVLYNYSSSLENGTFGGRPADYIWMLLFCDVLALIVAGFAGFFYFVSHAMVMTIIYVWSRYNSEGEVSLFFGIRCKAIYVPWAIMAINFLIGFSIWYDLLGIAVGHAYYFICNVYPVTYRKPNYLETPQWFINLLPQKLKGSFAFAAPAWGERAQANQPRGHQWGQGRALG
ncbi:derlin-1 [Heterostelium album PN500]|uniref:Derlin n=1 Tax=Heterostelium pallidum (strain ATCC 26659 / Pp 5 / PN500) TaxID=670386 RepID=D3BPH9_HETP5|nr:derlin-1 [Heterostelium album PN500]EFA76697.1 derlin-1 [Heterostelium album PN500]|eukprot:XP_020428829.1 derlin-1 [Heterostelium album PN500]